MRADDDEIAGPGYAGAFALQKSLAIDSEDEIESDDDIVDGEPVDGRESRAEAKEIRRGASSGEAGSLELATTLATVVRALVSGEQGERRLLSGSELMPTNPFFGRESESL